MRSTDLPSGAAREVQAGHVWEEVTAAGGTFELLPQQTFRVRAVGATTVTVAGVLAMTMADGEIEYFNAGTGTAGDKKTRVTVVISAGFVQVARQIERGRRSK